MVEGFKDVSALLGMTEALSESYVKLISAMLIHQMAEKALSCEDGKLKHGSCEIPNVGKIFFFENASNNQYSYTFIPADRFEEELKRAIQTGKSPLEKILEGTLIERLNTKYRGVV